MSGRSPAHERSASERSWQRADPHAPTRVPSQRPAGSRQPPGPHLSRAAQPPTRTSRAVAPAVASPVGGSLLRAAGRESRAGRHGRRTSALRLLLSALRRHRPGRH